MGNRLRIEPLLRDLVSPVRHRDLCSVVPDHREIREVSPEQAFVFLFDESTVIPLKDALPSSSRAYTSARSRSRCSAVGISSRSDGGRGRSRASKRCSAEC